MVDQIDQQRVENLGPAGRIVQTLTTFTDHLVHNRPGFVKPDKRYNIGVAWQQATLDKKGTCPRQVYTVTKVGRRQNKTLVGILATDGKTVELDGRKVGEYRSPGLFPEVALYLYQQVADVYRMDADFAARWASWQFQQENRDLKAILAAFMLVQEHSGQPVRGEDGEILFSDEDYREVGESMFLTGKDFNPKLVLRVGDILRLDGVATLNRGLGFARSARTPALGRYDKAVSKWLRHREENPRMLQGLVKSGFKHAVRQLARRVGYKPQSDRFFQILGWRQKQAEDGRREMALDLVIQTESWDGLSEREICQRILKEKPGFKVVVGRLPENVGLTRAIMMSCVQAGVLSDKDMLILVPTFEELGLLQVPEVRDSLNKAAQAADDARAAHIARNVRSKAAQEVLTQAADTAVAKAMEKATRNLRVYFLIDKSGSMDGALAEAKDLISKFLGGFPLERTHVSVFDTVGREVEIKAPQRAAVAHALGKYRAGGGTDHAEGIRCLLDKHRPQEDEDMLVIVIGDEQETYPARFIQEFQRAGVSPVAFGVLEINTIVWAGQGNLVKRAAAHMGVPCFVIDKSIFDDAYAVTTTLRNLIESTPAGRTEFGARTPRVNLVEQILKTDLLRRPAWAA